MLDVNFVYLDMDLSKIGAFLKSPKVFLISLIVPLAIFISSFFSYKEPNACGGWNMCAGTSNVPCDDYMHYLSFNGREMLGFSVIGMFITIYLIGILYSFLNKHNVLGWVLIAVLLAIGFGFA